MRKTADAEPESSAGSPEQGPIVDAGRAALASKVLKIKAEIGYIPKRGWNAHHKYNFATESDVTDTLRELMVAHRLDLYDSIVQVNQEAGRTRVELFVTLVDVETGFEEGASWFGEAADTQDKGIAKALTSARKTYLLKRFLVPTGDDPDAASGDVQPEGSPQNLAASAPEKEWLAGVFSGKPKLKADYIALCGTLKRGVFEVARLAQNAKVSDAAALINFTENLKQPEDAA